MLEGDFEKWDITVNFLALEEPVGIFVPDGLVQSFDGFGEAIRFHILFDLFDTAVNFAANPVLAHGVSCIRG